MTSSISHPDIARFCIVRQDYAAITNGNRCAAIMLSIFEGYTDWLKERGRSCWIDLSGNELSDAMVGLFSRRTVMDAGVLLEKLGLIRRKQKSSCDRTYQYLFLTDVVQERINLATLWNACSKLWLHSLSHGSFWLTTIARCSKALLGAIVPFGTMQESVSVNASSDPEPCNVPIGTTSYIDIDSVSSSNNTGLVVEEEEVVEEESDEPTDEEVGNACIQLRALSPYIDTNQTVRKYIRLNWANVPAAIAYIKEAIRTWKVHPDFNWTGQVVKTLKTGVPLLSSTPPPKKEPPPQPTDEQLLKLKALGEKLDYIDWEIDGGFAKVLHVCAPFKPMIPWWIALGVEI